MSILFNWVVEPRILFFSPVLFDRSGCAVTITREDGYIYHTYTDIPGGSTSSPTYTSYPLLLCISSSILFILF